MINTDRYQQLVEKTAIYPKEHSILYPSLGLCGEAGEVAEKVKKALRDQEGVFSEEKKQEIKKELGDVLWYITALGRDLGFSLSEIAEANIKKLEDRVARNVLNGSGDNR